MAKPSDNAMLQKAIRPAVLDRQSFIEAVGADSAEGIEAEAEVNRIQSLKGRRLSSMNSEERETARITFIYAEQYETGFADSRPGNPYEDDAVEAANAYKEVRTRLWGKTKMEAYCESATVVNVFDLVNSKNN